MLQADAADRGGSQWTNLRRMMQRTLPALRTTLLNGASLVLLVSAMLDHRLVKPLCAGIDPEIPLSACFRINKV